MSNLITLTGLLQNIILILAVIVGGIWGLYRFRLLREYEGNIEFKVATTCTPCENGSSLVFIDTTIKNTGSRTVIAVRKKYKNGKLLPVFSNRMETIYHSCILQIKCLHTNISNGFAYEWYNPNHFKKITNLPDEIDLLFENDIPPNKGEFWLNAGDACRLGAIVMVPPGHYLAKVAFVGNKGPADYCSRLFYFHVEERKRSSLNHKKKATIIPSIFRILR